MGFIYTKKFFICNLAREAQLVEQNIEAILVVSSNLTSGIYKYVCLYKFIKIS